MEGVIRMSQPKNKWIELFDGEYHTVYETPKKKNGEYNYILSYRGMYVYFTPKEFSELVGGFKEVESKLFKSNGNCYQ